MRQRAWLAGALQQKFLPCFFPPIRPPLWVSGHRFANGNGHAPVGREHSKDERNATALMGIAVPQGCRRG